MIVAVMYQVGAGDTFDLEYYLKRHVPLVNDLWGPLGMKRLQVLRGTGSPSGEAATYHIIALLDFDSPQAFQLAARQHGAEVLGDIVNFTGVKPVMQFNDELV